MWKNKAKTFMTVLLCTALLSSNMQTIQPVYAAQLPDGKDTVLSEGKEINPSETGSEELQETQDTTETQETSSKEETQTELQTKDAQTEELETENVQTEDTQVVSEEIPESQTSEKADTEQTQSEEELPETEESETEHMQNKEGPISFSEIVVNPLYQDFIRQSTLEFEIESIHEQEERKNNARNTQRANNEYSSVESAAVYVREQMVERNNTVTFVIPQNLYNANNETDSSIIINNIRTIIENVVETAVEHTENCSGREGDALRWGYGAYQSTFSVASQSAEITCTFMYYTTYEQEQKLTSKVNKVIRSMSLDGQKDYDKITLIHDYICDSVDYDYDSAEDHYIKFTAYGALCEGKAVCQGYAVLFYRLCKQAGLSVRVITGTGQGQPHAWNIVKCGADGYYNVDCTWDGQDTDTIEKWCLLNDKDFKDHVRDEEYAAEAFYKAYPMAGFSYQVERGKTLDCENELYIAITTVDGRTSLNAENGKPKIIIFYDKESPSSQATVQNISAFIADFGGVDLVAPETNNAAKEEVESFRQNYGCDKIAFCYAGEKDDFAAVKNKYINKADAAIDPSIIYEPVICYIDANDRLQHVTLYGYSKVHSAARVLTDLRQYCGYTYKAPEEPENPDEPEPSITYTITYILDGGVNNSSNPQTYTSSTDTIVLEDARRTGYIFEGWYTDNAFTSEPVTQTEKGSTGNLILFARWSVDTQSPSEYTITYVLNGGKNSRYNPTKYTLETGKITLYDASWTGALFDGWYKDPEFKEQITEIAEDSKGDITLYAKWKINKPEVYLEVAGDTVAIELPGEYYTETAEKILDRINAIRLEACKQGVRHPDYSGKNLTMADYVPLQWSADLEGIARQRAAEATVEAAHTRPNGQSCFSAVTFNNVRSAGECLAWNYEGLMTGIEQWYNEKKDWDNQTGAVTGHYQILISPMYTHIGIGAFKQSSGYYAVALSVNGYESVANTQKNDAHGKWKQTMEVKRSSVTKMTFDKNLATYIREGDTYRIPINMSVKGAGSTVTYYAGGDWSSSDEAVATVDIKGTVTAKSKGTARLTLSVGSQTITTEITVYGANESPIQIKAPAKTTYQVGEKLDITGGQITYLSSGGSVTKDITQNMVSGFDSETPGICRVTVTDNGYTAGFDTLIVDVPKLEARYGQTLKEIRFPENEYGTYLWENENQVVETTGESVFKASFTPKDTTSFQVLNNLDITVTVRTSLEGGRVFLKKNRFVYNGIEQEPKVVVEVAGKALTENSDYRLSYQGDRKNAGTAEAVVEGMGFYYGSIQAQFTIEPAPLTITAENLSILIGAPLPTADAYKIEVQGLAAGERLLREPTVECAIADTKKAGRYAIVPKDADAGSNYVITYINGTLLVAEEQVSYAVTFDVQGHGEAPEAYVGIKAGSTISKPEQEPRAEGYRFGGWYHDAACTKAWDFDTDTVQSDITLYAGWLQAGMDNGFAFREIPDCYYTGKACTPIVPVYDGGTLLKQNKDYTIKYFNNVNANQDGIRKKGSGHGADFNELLPYALITGKGDYKDIVKVNFNILPTSIGNGSVNAATGMTLKYAQQSVAGSKPIKLFTSLKYAKALKEGTDYTLVLTAVNARDQSGKKVEEGTVLERAVVPAGHEGEFLLTVKGIGNYNGSIQTNVYAADKDHLMKNAKITLGKNLKNVDYKGKAVLLTPGTAESEDTFTVKIGTTVLEPVKDYAVSYRSNNKVGKAEMIITGEGEYVGSKSVFFNIKGKPLAAKNISIEGLEDKVYTGTAWTQNSVKLTYLPENAPLSYGTDYTIKYSKNISKGTASIIFCGKGMYGGELKKTFKILPADISDSSKVTQKDTMKAITVPYSKAGATPVEEIALFNARGVQLQSGRDYTIQYKNNKAVAKPTDEKPPTAVIKGKGNYTGEITVPFTIEKGSLNGSSITILPSAVNYQTGKAPAYAYTPSVKVLDGKSALGKGKDFDLVYVNNTQADWEAYLQNPDRQTMNIKDMPHIAIQAVEGGSYSLEAPIRLPLPVYQNKLTKKNLIVEIDETAAVYTGAQVAPKVTVFYQGENGGRTKLTERKDYMVSYGANIKAGKNKGSITISGISPYYGSSVTVKFDIGQKAIAFGGTL